MTTARLPGSKPSKPPQRRTPTRLTLLLATLLQARRQEGREDNHDQHHLRNPRASRTAFRGERNASQETFHTSRSTVGHSDTPYRSTPLCAGADWIRSDRAGKRL